MKEIMGIETAKKTVLTDAEREAILENIVCKESIMKDAFSKGLLIDITGKKVSFKTLIDATKITFSTGNYQVKKIEERIHDLKRALVLNENTLNQFYVSTPIEFVKKVQDLIDFNNSECERLAAPYHQNDWKKYYEYSSGKISFYNKFNPTVLDINELISNIKNTSETIDEKKLNKKETIFLKAVKEINARIASFVYFTMEQNDNERWKNAEKFTRSISLGKSEVADAWTDGKTFITLEEKNVSAHPMKIIHLLVHEYCHNTLTMESHDHGNEFYQAYHDVYHHHAESLFEASVDFQKTFNKIMLKEGVKPKKTYDDKVEINETYESLKNTEIA